MAGLRDLQQHLARMVSLASYRTQSYLPVRTKLLQTPLPADMSVVPGLQHLLAPVTLHALTLHRPARPQISDVALLATIVDIIPLASIMGSMVILPLVQC